MSAAVSRVGEHDTFFAVQQAVGNDDVVDVASLVTYRYGQMVMGQWLIDFSRAYPGIVLDVRFENRIVDLLQEEVDIAVRVVSDPPQNLVARELGPVRFIACAARTYAASGGLPQALDDLQRVPIITASVVGRQLRVAGTREGVRQEVTLEPIIISEHFPFLRQAILA